MVLCNGRLCGHSLTVGRSDVDSRLWRVKWKLLGSPVTLPTKLFFSLTEDIFRVVRPSWRVVGLGGVYSLSWQPRRRSRTVGGDPAVWVVEDHYGPLGHGSLAAALRTVRSRVGHGT